MEKINTEFRSGFRPLSGFYKFLKGTETYSVRRIGKSVPCRGSISFYTDDNNEMVGITIKFPSPVGFYEFL